MEKYSIGEASAISGVSVPTLRYYDTIGLMKPSFVDENNNYRYYSDENVMNLIWIKQLRKLEFSLKEIQNIVLMGDSKFLERELANRLSDLKREKKKIQLKCNAVENLQGLLKEGNALVKESEIREKKFKSRCVISIIKQGTCETQNYTRWYAELLKIAEMNNLHITGELSIKYFSRMYEVNIEDAKVEASATVFEKDSECAFFRVEKEFCGISKIYKGPYTEIKSGYMGMLEYMKDRKYPIPDYFMFRYLVNRAFTMEQNEYRTEIILPIEN